MSGFQVNAFCPGRQIAADVVRRRDWLQPHSTPGREDRRNRVITPDYGLVGHRFTPGWWTVREGYGLPPIPFARDSCYAFGKVDGHPPVARKNINLS